MLTKITQLSLNMHSQLAMHYFFVSYKVKNENDIINGMMRVVNSIIKKLSYMKKILEE